MTEQQTIEYIKGMNAFERLTVYMSYFCNMLYHKYSDKEVLIGFANHKSIYGIDDKLKTKFITFEQFCSSTNYRVNKIEVDDWKERGFGCKEWVVFNAPSIYHYVYHNIK